jgi:hypothetical protein
MSQVDDEPQNTTNRRWRRNTSYVVAAMMGALLIYGLSRYPDAPLQACNDHSYCGKQGQPHTQSQFEAFEIWQNVLFWVWPIGMLALYVLNRDRFRSRGRRPRE